MPVIFVTIVNYNGENQTLSCLQSLNEVRTEGFNLNVIVLDNGSVRAFQTEQVLYKNFKLSILKSEKNLGFTGGQNLAIKKALKNGADYIVVLNNDVILDKGLIAELLESFQDKSDLGLVSPKIYFARGYEFHKDKYKENDLGNVIWYAGGKMDWKNVIGFHRGVDEVDKGQYDRFEETNFVSGCCMMVKKEVFEKVGFFDERYFLYYEDNDFSQRVKTKGFKIYYQPKAKLWHLNAGSTGGSGSGLQDYFITRNRLLFGFNYASLRTKSALLKESIKFMFIGRKLQKKGVLDFYTGRFGKGSYRI